MKKGSLVVFSEPRRGCKKPEPEVVAEILACHGDGPYQLLEDIKICNCGHHGRHSEDCASRYVDIRAEDRRFQVRVQDIKLAPAPVQVPASV